jgi:hypothetical protein
MPPPLFASSLHLAIAPRGHGRLHGSGLQQAHIGTDNHERQEWENAAHPDPARGSRAIQRADEREVASRAAVHAFEREAMGPEQPETSNISGNESCRPPGWYIPLSVAAFGHCRPHPARPFHPDSRTNQRTGVAMIEKHCGHLGKKSAVKALGDLVI